MTTPERAWIDFADRLPDRTLPFEVLHFGHTVAPGPIQLALYDEYGICPIASEPGEHCKRSTMTHWRYLDVD